MADPPIKVTDKRMFTSDGELREEFRFLEEVEPEAPDPPESVAPEPDGAAAEVVTEPPAESPAQPSAEPDASAQAGAERQPPLDLPSTGPGPQLFDLVAALAEPAAVYLGEQPLPGGQSAENLELARFYIDLLDLLRHKTAGNLSAQESAFLEDTLYQLRVRYMQKTG